MGCARNGEVSGSKCEERRECGEMGSVKRHGAVKKGNGESDKKGEQKPHIQFLCTAPLYNTKHTVVLIRSCSLHCKQPH